MARRRKRRRRKQSQQFSFTSYLPKGRKAKKRAQKAQRVQAEKLNNEFETVNETPFNTIDVSTSKSEQKVVQDMMLRYNLTSDEKKYNTMLERGFVNSLNEYSKILAIYQSPVYQMLKENGYSDSYQIRDLVQSFGNNISSTDLEYALLGLIESLKLQQDYNTKLIRDAMELGFSFDDAVYLTQDDKIGEIKASESLLEIRDRLNALLETRQIRYELAQELRNERW